MKKAVVKELMVPLEEYATAHTAATLHEALLTLEKIQEQQDRERYLYLHRAVLVYDDSGRIVGKVSQLDALRALEPKYRDMGEAGSLSSPSFLLIVRQADII
jgi:CBS domain-containing protein